MTSLPPRASFTGSVALALAFGLSAGLLPLTPAKSDDFYQGKRIQMIVGSGPGGGYDTYARLLTRHMGQHLPGQPAFVVQNMEGAGSIVAANFVYNVAPQDGTVILQIQRGAPMVQILGQSGPQFESDRFQWLGSLNNEAGVIGVMKRSGITSLDDVFRREAILGTTGPNDTEVFPALMNNLLGAQFRLIAGYPSTPPVHLAMQRGELDGISQSWASFKQQAGDELENIAVLVQMSTSRHPELDAMNVPFIYDFITADRLRPGFTVEEVTTYFDLMLSTKAMGRPFTVGPGVPAERVALLREAFMKTAEDPAFLADAERQRREIVTVNGDDLQAIVTRLANAPREIVDRLSELTRFQGLVEVVETRTPEYRGPVSAVEGGGRSLTVQADGQAVTASISGSRTKVMIGGADGDRGAIQVGMTCTIMLPEGSEEATEIHCD